MLRLVSILGVLTLLPACALARKGNNCAPIDPELSLDYGGLYNECTVDQRARLAFAPRIQYPGAVQTNAQCLYGVLRFIVDTTGKPIVQSVELVATNDLRYSELMLNGLPQVRFSPGKVKKHPVHQVAHWESRTPVSQLMSMRTTSTATTSC